MKKIILIAVFSVLSTLIFAYFLCKENILVGLYGLVWMIGLLAITVGPFILLTFALASIVKKLDPKDKNE